MPKRVDITGRERKPVTLNLLLELELSAISEWTKTKLGSVFASKFSPDLDAETFFGYLKEKLGRELPAKILTQCTVDAVHSKLLLNVMRLTKCTIRCRAQYGDIMSRVGLQLSGQTLHQLRGD